MKVTTLVHVRKSLKYLKTPISQFTLREKLAPIFYKLVKIAFLVEIH